MRYANEARRPYKFRDVVRWNSCRYIIIYRVTLWYNAGVRDDIERNFTPLYLSSKLFREIVCACVLASAWHTQMHSTNLINANWRFLHCSILKINLYILTRANLYMKFIFNVSLLSCTTKRNWFLVIALINFDILKNTHFN